MIEYSNNYAKTSENLYRYCRYESTLNDDGVFVHFDGNTTDSFKFKEKMTDRAGNNCAKNVEIMVN